MLCDMDKKFTPIASMERLGPVSSSERGKSVTRLALRFCLEYPPMISMLTGMTGTAQVEEKTDVVDHSVVPDVMEEARTGQ